MRDREAAQPSTGLSDLGPSDVGPSGCRAGDILVHQPSAEPGQPVAADIALLGSGRAKDPKPSASITAPGLRPPQPGASGDDRMWRRQCQRTAGERQAIGDELRAERRQEVVGARHGAGFVDQPGESGGQSHARDHAACRRMLSSPYCHKT